MMCYYNFDWSLEKCISKIPRSATLCEYKHMTFLPAMTNP